MRSIRRVPTIVALAAMALAAGLTAAPAAAQLTEAQIGMVTAPAFAPVAGGVANRPSMLVETDSYIYGPQTGFSSPQVTVSIDNEGYNQAATLYVYWQNRDSGQTLWYSVRDGFGAGERDLFGTADDPRKIFVPNLDEFRLWGPGSAFGPVPGAIPSGVGRYQFVVEVRDADGQAVIARTNSMYNVVAGVEVIPPGNVNGGNWTKNNAYLLAGPVYVAGGVLNVEAGTVVLADKGGQGTLIVLPEGRINANGNAMLPIVFTSAQDVGDRAPGDWGGLVLSGNAPVGGAPREGEGDSGSYGGDDPGHDCGTLRYVRVEFAGIRFSTENELNGIAVQGCGTQTTIDHVQVHFNSDDGLEFFGGTADAKYVLITNAEDDSLDWTFGWQGRLQFLVAIQGGSEADNGIEADNDENNANLQPRSNPTIYNATFVGAKGTGAQLNNEAGLLLRRGTGATLRNLIVTNFSDPPVVVDGADSQGLLGTELVISHAFFHDNNGTSNVQDYLQNDATQVRFVDPRLPNPFGLTPDVAPLPGSPARGAGSSANPPNDGFFDGVNFAGGVDPNDPWIWEGWTTFSDN
jgi:hypothetical protein